MTAKTKTLTDITIDQINQRHTLQSYWFGEKWCPAVHPQGDGYSIRIGHHTGNGYKYDYFKVDADGVIQTSPRGCARDYNRKVRVSDVVETAQRMAAPDPSATRFRLGF